MQVTLLNAVTDSTPGATHSNVNNKLINEDLTFELELTGAPTGTVITVYGSIDGSTYNPIATHDAIANGNMFHISGKPVRYIYAAATTLSGGTAPTANLEMAY